jgi:hypothetical protein
MKIAQPAGGDDDGINSSFARRGENLLKIFSISYVGENEPAQPTRERQLPVHFGKD